MRFTIAALAALLLLTSCAEPEKPFADHTVTFNRDDDNKRVDVLVGGEPFTTFHYADSLYKPLLFPVKAPNGAVVTRGYPLDPQPGDAMDHPHHTGQWFNFGDVNGIDFWNNSDARPAEEAHRYGRIKFVEINELKEGETGSLAFTAEWIDKDSTTMLIEQSVYYFHGSDTARVIDRVTTLKAMLPSVRFKDNKEGLFAIRVASPLELERPDSLRIIGEDGKPTTEKVQNPVKLTGDFRNAEGITGKETWGTKSPWVALDGELDSTPISLVIFDHSGNSITPPSYHARHYGLFSANNLGSTSFKGENEVELTLMAGETETFKHRLAVFSGVHPSKETINELARQFNLLY